MKTNKKNEKHKNKNKIWLSMVEYTFNPCTQKAKTGYDV